jgi:O-succinylbenzoate synthase
MRFEYRPYRRSFRQPLQTSHGVWTVREGIILRLTDDADCVGFGEISPLAWFGSETFEEAIEFCQQLPDRIDVETIATIPTHLSACQFGFESAQEMLVTEFSQSSALSHSALLPTGHAALNGWKDLWEQGYRTFKWKIGVADIEDEIQIFEQLIQTLPAEAFLRLDANAGLTFSQAETWLQHCDSLSETDCHPTLEFLEQPLAVSQFDQMQKLSQIYSTPLAIDESVATLSQLRECYQKGWRGIFVIKPAIVGSPSQLRKFCQETAIDAVFSSVFETTIGRQAGLRLAAELSLKHRAVGYGTSQWFDEMEEGDRQWQSL